MFLTQEMDQNGGGGERSCRCRAAKFVLMGALSGREALEPSQHRCLYSAGRGAPQSTVLIRSR